MKPWESNVKCLHGSFPPDYDQFKLFCENLNTGEIIGTILYVSIDYLDHGAEFSHSYMENPPCVLDPHAIWYCVNLRAHEGFLFIIPGWNLFDIRCDENDITETAVIIENSVPLLDQNQLWSNWMDTPLGGFLLHSGTDDNLDTIPMLHTSVLDNGLDVTNATVVYDANMGVSLLEIFALKQRCSFSSTCLLYGEGIFRVDLKHVLQRMNHPEYFYYDGGLMVTLDSKEVALLSKLTNGKSFFSAYFMRLVASTSFSIISFNNISFRYPYGSAPPRSLLISAIAHALNDCDLEELPD